MNSKVLLILCLILHLSHSHAQTVQPAKKSSKCGAMIQGCTSIKTGSAQSKTVDSTQTTAQAQTPSLPTASVSNEVLAVMRQAPISTMIDGSQVELVPTIFAPEASKELGARIVIGDVMWRPSLVIRQHSFAMINELLELETNKIFSIQPEGLDSYVMEALTALYSDDLSDIKRLTTCLASAVVKGTQVAAFSNYTSYFAAYHANDCSDLAWKVQWRAEAIAEHAKRDFPAFSSQLLKMVKHALSAWEGETELEKITDVSSKNAFCGVYLKDKYADKSTTFSSAQKLVLSKPEKEILNRDGQTYEGKWVHFHVTNPYIHWVSCQNIETVGDLYRVFNSSPAGAKLLKGTVNEF